MPPDRDRDGHEDAPDDSDEAPAGVAREKDEGSQTGGLSLRLPPFRLPEFFPPDFVLRFPIPGGLQRRRVSARTVLLACIAFDVVDAVAALVVGSQLVGGARAIGGLVLAATVASVTGLAYGWELLAVLLGYPVLTVFPSLTVLLILHARR